MLIEIRRPLKTRIGLPSLLLFFFLVQTAPGCRAGDNSQEQNSTRIESTLDRIRDSKHLRIGYSGYPPFLNIDPENKLPRDGFSVELAKALVQEWNEQIEIEWVPTNWSNVRVDLLANKFDLIVEPVFRTIPRAAAVGFTKPFAYFAYAVGCVRADDDRFHSIDQLNSPSYSIAVLQGASAHEYVKRNLPLATNLKVLSGTSVEATLDEVLLGRVDVTLADLNTIDRYMAAHSGLVKAVFTDPPPGRVPAGFMLRPGDYKFAAFLDASLDFFEASGEIEKLKQKYAIR